jgi:glucose dehydrogenase
MSLVKRSLVTALCLVVLSASALSADWPQWRGPHRDGRSQETGLLKEWPKEGPPLIWQAKDIGEGYSTPAIVGGNIYLISNRGMDDEFVHALSVADGKQLWSTRLGKVGPNQGPQYPGSRSTPTVDGGVLYALGSDGDLACVDIATGSIRWKKSLRSDFGGKPGKWAYSESPLVDGDVVVCTPGGTDATIVALDKKTGDTIWKSAVPEGDEAAYASIIVVTTDKVKQYVQFLEKGLVGVDAQTGKLLWRYEQTAKGSPANIPTPVAQDQFVYSAAGRSGGGLVELKAGPEGVAATQIYFMPKLPSSIGGSVKMGDYLYGTNSQGLMCVDFKTGEVKWQERGVGAGAVCVAEGLLYLHGEKGDVALVEATPEAYREKGRMTPPDQPQRGKSSAWAYPVVSGGRLYLRDLGSLWSFDVSAK